MSILAAPLGPLSEFWYLKDYWSPEYFSSFPIEDMLFAFLIGGIGAVAYEELLGRRLINRHARKHNWLLGLFAIIGMTTLVTLNNILGINSIYASSLGFILPAVIIIIIRKDLLKDAFISGFFLVFISFLFYRIFIPLFPSIINRWWMLQNTSGILIVGIPLEELLWFFSWGMFDGPLYEFIMGLSVKPLPTKGKGNLFLE